MIVTRRGMAAVRRASFLCPERFAPKRPGFCKNHSWRRCTDAASRSLGIAAGGIRCHAVRGIIRHPARASRNASRAASRINAYDWPRARVQSGPGGPSAEALVGYLVAELVIGFAPAVGAGQPSGWGHSSALRRRAALRCRICCPSGPSPFRRDRAGELLATPLGMAVGWALGWSAAAGLSSDWPYPWPAVRSCCCACCKRRLVDTERGKITIGWLIVQDIAMVLARSCCRRSSRCSREEAPPDAVMLTQTAEV